MVIVSSEALDVIKMRIASHKVWGVRILTKPAGCNGWKWDLDYEDNPSFGGDSIYYDCIAVDPQTLSMVEKIEIDMETIENLKNEVKENSVVKTSGSLAVIDALLSEKVATIFGYPGGAIMPIYDALYDYQNNLNHI